MKICEKRDIYYFAFDFYKREDFAVLSVFVALHTIESYGNQSFSYVGDEGLCHPSTLAIF